MRRSPQSPGGTIEHEVANSPCTLKALVSLVFRPNFACAAFEAGAPAPARLPGVAGGCWCLLLTVVALETSHRSNMKYQPVGTATPATSSDSQWHRLTVMQRGVPHCFAVQPAQPVHTGHHPACPSGWRSHRPIASQTARHRTWRAAAEVGAHQPNERGRAAATSRAAVQIRQARKLRSSEATPFPWARRPVTRWHELAADHQAGVVVSAHHANT